MLEFIAGTAFGGAVPVLLEVLGIGVLLYALLGPTPSRYASGVRRAALFVAVLLVTPFLFSTLVPVVLSATPGGSAGQTVLMFRIGAAGLILAALTWVVFGFRRDESDGADTDPAEPLPPTAEKSSLY